MARRRRRRDDRIDTFKVAPLQIQCLAADVQLLEISVRWRPAPLSSSPGRVQKRLLRLPARFKLAASRNRRVGHRTDSARVGRVPCTPEFRPP